MTHYYLIILHNIDSAYHERKLPDKMTFYCFKKLFYYKPKGA
jgi:hypothetical protein